MSMIKIFLCTDAENSRIKFETKLLHFAYDMNYKDRKASKCIQFYVNKQARALNSH